jgi:hypothetical protein
MNPKQTIAVLFGMTVFIGLSGCEPVGEQVMIQNARGMGYSQGYADGCATGRHVAGSTETNATKNTLQYLNDKEYKKGWDTGYEECKFREERVAKLSEKTANQLRK